MNGSAVLIDAHNSTNPNSSIEEMFSSVTKEEFDFADVNGDGTRALSLVYNYVQTNYVYNIWYIYTDISV